MKEVRTNTLKHMHGHAKKTALGQQSKDGNTQLSMDGWGNKMQCTDTIEYYSAIKGRNTFPKTMKYMLQCS
jgi:hypothetical protein